MVKKIVIVNGNPDSVKYSITGFVDILKNNLISGGYDVTVFILTDENINSCLGCWDCWWKTPGICRQKDDAEKLLSEIINADLVIYASPVIMGFYSALLKLFQDRMIPLLHPYIIMDNGVSRHIKRYSRYPLSAVILEKGDATDAEIDNVRLVFKRIFYNSHTVMKFFKIIEKTNRGEIINEISSI